MNIFKYTFLEINDAKHILLGIEMNAEMNYVCRDFKHFPLDSKNE